MNSQKAGHLVTIVLLMGTALFSVVNGLHPGINGSELYDMHYGQSQLDDRASSINALGPYQQVAKDEKLLSLFTLVRFANNECVSSVNFLKGTCYTYWDCIKGGSIYGDSVVQYDHGSCAGGFGLCCTSVLGCGGSSRNNNTWLRSPGYPSKVSSGLDCSQTIFIEENICQLRLEIEDLSLNYPDNTGTCTTDYLTVSQDTKFDKLCGVTKDNHFYLDVMYSVSNQVKFDFHVDSSTSFDRSWSIKVAKISCHSDEEVPRGCGHYYTGTSGTIKALNYEAPDTNDNILSGLNYAVCVRMENGYCKNTYDETAAGKSGGWTTVCPDIFERPGRPESSPTAPSSTIKCYSGSGTTLIPIISTYSYLSPHYFKLDTTRDTTDTHLVTDGTFNNGGVYYMEYKQTAC